MFISPWNACLRKSWESLRDVKKNFVGHFTAGEGILIFSVSSCPNTSASRRLASFELWECLKTPFAFVVQKLSLHRALVRSESNREINFHPHQGLITFTRRFMSSGVSRGGEPCGMGNSLFQVILRGIKTWEFFLNMLIDSHWFPLSFLGLTGPNLYFPPYFTKALHHTWDEFLLRVLHSGAKEVPLNFWFLFTCRISSYFHTIPKPSLNL